VPVTPTAAGGQTRTMGGGAPRWLYRAARRLAHLVNRTYFRVTVEGAGAVPDRGPVILAPVHRSNIDFLIASSATKRKVFYMAKDSLWRRPRFGAFLESFGAFPVNRQGSDRLALDRAQAVLERGEVLILFPEGTRRSGTVVEHLHDGAAFLAARTGAVIVPIGIGGSDAAMPKGSKMIRPVKIHVEVGEPLTAPARSDLGRVSRKEVRVLTEQLRLELQKLYDLARQRVGEGGPSSTRSAPASTD
jgi:1-acyl-sn-glycerol-3-phosphate acyltransferase